MLSLDSIDEVPFDHPLSPQNGGSAMITHHCDMFDYGEEGGEAITFTGDFFCGKDICGLCEKPL